MKEIGGYIELDRHKGSMLHDDGIKLNCGRNALAYLIEAKFIKKIVMPRFMCDSCNGVLKKYAVSVRYYSVGMDFKPKIEKRQSDEWFYVVNFYGQLSDEYIKSLGNNVIVDNAQAYFNNPIEDVDTLYTCRKFFGVADGAVLYTNVKLNELPIDQSFNRMHFLLGRFERTASDFYKEYIENNCIFANEPIKMMSKLTENLLRGIDYKVVKQIRTDNFEYLHNHLGKYNKLSLIVPEGAFMYPFYIDNGAEVRRELQLKKIFVPILWPAVFDICKEDDTEYDMAKNILPLPIDQRYSNEEMKYMESEIKKLID